MGINTHILPSEQSKMPYGIQFADFRQSGRFHAPQGFR
ncbi:MAG: hypothetical protein BWY83_03064 [bacterium ADurb.Bin478]|nr:MAG: hypothetical protein BWY83_03064 [bacterium ADurb.Bin478]